MSTETEITTTDSASTDADVDEHEPRVADLARETIDRLGDSARVDRVYADPVEVGDRTVVPAARVVYGFGGGLGSGTDDDGETGEGGGGAAGVRATPVGALEVTADETRFVRFSDATGRRLAGLALAVGAGYLLGRLVGRR
jgi:uncharacterized spore protein YtfJ